jgi:16S rRNA (guanine527-N7)-methyltransferase
MNDTTVERSIAGLAERFTLTPAAAARLAALTRFLASEPTAPTAIHGATSIVEQHVADSLVALELEELRPGLRIVDIGSGAGMPGLPLAIALPDTSVVLVESNARKRDFIASAIRLCGLENAEAIATRAETWSEGIGRFDVVTARALGPLDVVAEYAAPLLRVGGSLIAWRGQRELAAEARGARAAAILGLRVAEAVRVTPFPGARNRYLHVMLKVRATPDRFPRRVGMAAKRPLGI